MGISSQTLNMYWGKTINSAGEAIKGRVIRLMNSEQQLGAFDVRRAPLKCKINSVRRLALS